MTTTTEQILTEQVNLALAERAAGAITAAELDTILTILAKTATLCGAR